MIGTNLMLIFKSIVFSGTNWYKIMQTHKCKSQSVENLETCCLHISTEFPQKEHVIIINAPFQFLKIFDVHHSCVILVLKG